MFIKKTNTSCMQSTRLAMVMAGFLVSLSLSLPATKNAHAGIPPEIIPALAEQAPKVVGAIWKKGENIAKGLKKWNDKRKNSKNSSLSDVSIVSKGGNRAEVAFKYACGYKYKTKKGKRYRVSDVVLVNGKRVYGKNVKHKRRSGHAVINIKNFLPIKELRANILHKETKMKIAYRIETRCTTIKHKRRFDSVPVASGFVTIDLRPAMEKVAKRQGLLRR